MSESTTPTPTSQSSPIKVIGIGGGGSNAVNTMYNRGIAGVDFIICNTDSQALDASPVPIKVQLGISLTSGQGAGSRPEVGRNAAIESLDEVMEKLGENTKMVFITAGMGGGTGTGAAPIIAKSAKERDILTVGIVTVPFAFEGKRRAQQADEGLEAMREAVDTLLIIRNDKLRELYSELTIRKAFANADDVLCTAAKGIAEVITLTGDINVDMNDVNTVMKNSGRAIMGSGKASGEGRAYKAINDALESPLLNDKDITGANFVLLNITFGTEEILMDEITDITEFIQEAAGQEADVIWGYAMDETLEDDLCVTVIATGFEGQVPGTSPHAPQKKWLGDTDAQSPSQRELPDATAPKTAFTPGNQPISASTTLKWNSTLPKETTVPLGDSSQHLDSEPITPLTPLGDIPQNDPLQFTLKPNEDPMASDSNSEPDASATPSESAAENTDSEKINIFKLDDDDTPMHEKPNFFPSKSDTAESAAAKPTEPSAPSAEDIVPRKADRLSRIKQFTKRIKKPGEIADMENTPAFKRRNVVLDEVQPSNASTASRVSFQEEEDEDGEKHIQIRTDNPFLHDNVD